MFRDRNKDESKISQRVMAPENSPLPELKENLRLACLDGESEAVKRFLGKESRLQLSMPLC